MSDDPLELILNTLRPQNEIFAQPQLNAPWGLKQPELATSAFHFVLAGDCFLRLDKQDELISLNPGDFVFFPFGASHQIMSSPGALLLCSEKLFSDKSEQQIESMKLGGEGLSCTLICGSFSFQQWGQETILRGLDNCIIIPTRNNKTITSLFQLIYAERMSKLAGSKIAAARLLDALLIHLFRQMIESQSLNNGWLPALKDSRLSQVLYAIHNKPEHAWTIEKLAQLANLSRSAFCTRFKTIMNQSPMDYLNHWRIGLACQKLEASMDSVLTIGLDIGFNSSDVFIRNFKKIIGYTPESYRKNSL